MHANTPHTLTQSHTEHTHQHTPTRLHRSTAVIRRQYAGSQQKMDNRHKHQHTLTHSNTHRYKHTCAHALLHVRECTSSLALSLSDTYIETRTHTHTDTQTDGHSHTHTHTHTHPHTHGQTDRQTVALTCFDGGVALGWQEICWHRDDSLRVHQKGCKRGEDDEGNGGYKREMRVR